HLTEELLVPSSISDYPIVCVVILVDLGSDIDCRSNFLCRRFHRIDKDLKVLGIQSAINYSGLTILVLCRVDQPACFPGSVVFVADLPEFSTTVIIADPIGSIVRGLLHWMSTKTITSI